MRISDWSSDVCSSDLSTFMSNPHSFLTGPNFIGQLALDIFHSQIRTQCDDKADRATRQAQHRNSQETEDQDIAFRILRRCRHHAIPRAKQPFFLIFDLSEEKLDFLQRSVRTPGRAPILDGALITRSEEHTSELQSLMRISYAVFCLKKKTKNTDTCITSVATPDSTHNSTS